ncbi:MAG: hypothetical protein H0U71_04970 [Gammaproteobacteria bacterium]|nr:hypothetical protein [Gammaproteobacteria bacterium]
MIHREFCLWLDGFFSLENNASKLTPKQLNIIDSHLNLVKLIDGELQGFPKWLKVMITPRLSDSHFFDQTKIENLTLEIKTQLVSFNILTLSRQPYSSER